MKKSKSVYSQVEHVDLSQFTSTGKNAKVISLVAKNAKEKKYLERLDALEMQKGLLSSTQRPSDWLDKEGIELTDKKSFGKMEFIRPEKLTKRSFSGKIVRRALHEKKYELRTIREHDLVPVEVITVKDKSMNSEQKAIENSFLKALLSHEKNRRSTSKPSTPKK